MRVTSLSCNVQHGQESQGDLAAEQPNLAGVRLTILFNPMWTRLGRIQHTQAFCLPELPNVVIPSLGPFSSTLQRIWEEWALGNVMAYSISLGSSG